ncbi:putative bifunctional diguanylate cyclase/phosphodiesterase [Defluviimonas salinarum]|uniref:EAL domain-containing protein n=1 Tax=Defluviimonas salinarum TaxID=2992147 RepID=A0ABT3IYW1_9RHOB|nr:EAL domain-containing protein [Defluviimonas salinarum]MCW3780619.1 EAL domain-containing protein [Defluviimonas salinarum]
MFRQGRGEYWRHRAARLIQPDYLALAPALVLGWLWFGPEGAAIAAAGLPAVWLARRPARAGGTGCVPPVGTDRDAIIAALDHAYEAEEATGKRSACLVVGLDEPERLTETYGLTALDRVLSRLTERLGGVLREQDEMARIDGNRFAVALAPARRLDLETVIQIAGRLKSAVAEPVSIDAATAYVTASVGFCLSARSPARSGTDLLTAAELAQEEAIRNGPAAIRAYSADIGRAARDRDALSDRIEAALETGEIVAYFQPQLSTDTGDVDGFEALARWQHPERGVLPPAEFLPVVQAAGLGERLGEVILGHSLAALRGWDRAGIKVPSVSVNFARAELCNPSLVAKLKWELDRFDLAPRRLTVEVLESVVAEAGNDLVVRNIAALAELGCGIDLDDFGTGHASLAAIRRFSVQRIKIDRSYVTRVDLDPSQQRMVTAVLSMADRLGIKTLAEGVETIGEHALLAQLGCSHVQGFAIARPMPYQATAEWLRKHRSKLTATPGMSRRSG